MYDLGYLQEINHDDLPTAFENLLPSLQSPAFDPERKFSVPWQSGMGGIWVDTAKAPDIKSVNDLFDPKYKGKVTMLSELRETVPLVMLAEGIDPVEASNEDWLNAIDKIKSAANSGQIRRFTGNDYTEDLTAGNIVAAIGWSGDASLVENENAEWRMPTEGCSLWSDNMVIPVGAPNTRRGAGLDGLRLPAQGRGRHHRIRRIHLPGRRGQGTAQSAGLRTRRQRAGLPHRGVHRRTARTRTRHRTSNRSTKPGRK